MYSTLHANNDEIVQQELLRAYHHSMAYVPLELRQVCSKTQQPPRIRFSLSLYWDPRRRAVGITVSLVDMFTEVLRAYWLPLGKIQGTKPRARKQQLALAFSFHPGGQTQTQMNPKGYIMTSAYHALESLTSPEYARNVLAPLRSYKRMKYDHRVSVLS